MKFTDGYWMIKEGFTPIHPVEIFEAEKTKNGISILAPTKAIQDRADILNLPTISLKISSPLEDVISVKIIHHAGSLERGPYFELTNEGPDCISDLGDKITSFRSGRLRVELDNKGPWSMRFLGEGKLLTESGIKSIGHVTDPQGNCFMHEQLSLGVGELVYGMGERFTHFVKNGQTIDIWNKDGGTSSDQAYKNIPFYISNRGYGVFVNNSGAVSYEAGSEKVNRVQISVPGESLEYMVIYGATPAEILERYTALTGRPALPPAWSFGLWLTTSFTTSYDEATVLNFIDGMEERGIPLHVFHFDCFWMKAFRWSDFLFDEETFGNFENLIKKIHDRGIKVCLWINPYIAQNARIFPEAVENGYLIKKTNGDVWQTDLWQAGMGIVDFTNPEAQTWYISKLEHLMDMGVDSFKTDFGERIPSEDVVYHDGSDPVKMHNYYAYQYNEAVFKLLQTKQDQSALFARSASAGSQKFPVHWGGDCFSNFYSLAETLRGGLSLALSGFGFWSHDIGGFEGTPDPAVFKRWIAFGLMSSHSRLHGSTSYRVPWFIDEESVDVLRHFTKQKIRLMPYLYSTSLKAVETGTPVLRPMMFEFPEDRGCDYLDRQYMLGDSILVAPIMRMDDRVEYYLPEGTWTEFSGGRTVKGPCWMEEKYDFMNLPQWVRENSVLAVGNRKDRPDYDFRENVTLELYRINDGAEVSVKLSDQFGKNTVNFVTRRTGNQYKIDVSAKLPEKNWSVLVVNETDVITSSVAAVSKTNRGTLITSSEKTLSFHVNE